MKSTEYKKRGISFNLSDQEIKKETKL